MSWMNSWSPRSRDSCRSSPGTAGSGDLHESAPRVHLLVPDSGDPLEAGLVLPFDPGLSHHHPGGVPGAVLEVRKVQFLLGHLPDVAHDVAHGGTAVIPPARPRFDEDQGELGPGLLQGGDLLEAGVGPAWRSR